MREHAAHAARHDDAEADGIRVHALAHAPSPRWRALALAALASALLLLLLGLRKGEPAPAAAHAPAPPPVATAAPPAPIPSSRDASRVPTAATVPRASRSSMAAVAGGSPALASEWPSGDPNDLASHFAPGDPVPTMRELITALREAGVRTGIAAFNPPGTSPPLRGLAVPADYVLPPGYARHHQVTDDGVLLEPILMYAPDAVFFDRHGRPVELPADRVVPPEHAPPGLPIRLIELPAPDE